MRRSRRSGLLPLLSRDLIFWTSLQVQFSQMADLTDPDINEG